MIDDEMHSLIYRTLRGIELTPQTLNIEAIKSAVLGDGHFLGDQHTLDAMERDYYYPSLSDRNDPKTWEEQGAKTIRDVARMRVNSILDTHHPGYLDLGAGHIIRDKFNILLPAQRNFPEQKHASISRYLALNV